MRVGEFNCVTQRVIEYYENALRGQVLTDIRRKKFMCGRLGTLKIFKNQKNIELVMNEFPLAVMSQVKHKFVKYCFRYCFPRTNIFSLQVTGILCKKDIA